MSRGHSLKVVATDSDDFRLSKYGEYLWDNIVFMASGTNDIDAVSKKVDYTKQRFFFCFFSFKLCSCAIY